MLNNILFALIAYMLYINIDMIKTKYSLLIYNKQI